MPRPCDTAARKIETLPTERTRKLGSPASKAFGEALPKHSNSIQIRTHVAGKAPRRKLRTSRRYIANECREVSRQQVACARMGKGAPRKNAIRNCPGPHLVGSIARKTRLNERKIGVASKARSGLWRLVRGTSALHGPFPVRATDHIDRAKGILRGCRGVVVGWSQEHVTESCEQGDAISIWNTLPVAIYVRFDTAATWVVDGLQQANVYPVSPQRKQWHLDKHRQRPVLRVTRRQYPLAPAFATTAHAAQGQTAKGQVVADLHIGPHGDPLTAYVAVTRVTGRSNLAILRPFDPKAFGKDTTFESLARRRDRLGSTASKVCGGETMCGVLGPKTQK